MSSEQPAEDEVTEQLNVNATAEHEQDKDEIGSVDASEDGGSEESYFVRPRRRFYPSLSQELGDFYLPQLVNRQQFPTLLDAERFDDEEIAEIAMFDEATPFGTEDDFSLRRRALQEALRALEESKEKLREAVEDANQLGDEAYELAQEYTRMLSRVWNFLMLFNVGALVVLGMMSLLFFAGFWRGGICRQLGHAFAYLLITPLCRAAHEQHRPVRISARTRLDIDLLCVAVSAGFTASAGLTCAVLYGHAESWEDLVYLAVNFRLSTGTFAVFPVSFFLAVAIYRVYRSWKYTTLDKANAASETEGQNGEFSSFSLYEVFYSAVNPVPLAQITEDGRRVVYVPRDHDPSSSS
ncbi:unnamed protein product [Amoebophrya sp. A120]|nr:unnamed protein product [Amoebophrya sp. A120]|eukprot:GSA120T00016552001.1